MEPPPSPSARKAQDFSRLGQGKYRDPQEFVGSIRFAETLGEYVQAILRNTGVYKHI
jgi:hypothetical protein